MRVWHPYVVDAASTSHPDASRVWVFDGGASAPRVPPALAPPTTVICADSGLAHALRAGFTPDLLVGDLDSVAPEAIERWKRANPDGRVERHRADKDNSDLDLALAAAVALEPDEMVVLSGGSGRLDHLVVGLLALTQPAVSQLSPTAYVGDSVALPITATQSRRLPSLEVPSVVTLLALGGDARLTTAGLRWNLTHADVLAPASTRGLSNEPVGDEAPRVTVTEGTVLALVVPRDTPAPSS